MIYEEKNYDTDYVFNVTVMCMQYSKWGDNSTQGSKNDTSSGLSSMNNQNQNGSVHGDTPRMVILRTIEEFEELISAAVLPDDELAVYLVDHSYDWNGITGRYSLELFLEPFRILGYPDVPIDIIDEITERDGITERKYFSVVYYPDRGYSDVKYMINGIRYRFFLQMDGAVNDYSGMEKVGTYAIEDLEFDLYEYPDGYGLVGEVYYENLQIQIIVQYYEHIEDVSFEPFFWHKVE